MEPFSTITTVPLGTTFLHAPYISEELVSLIQRNKSHGKKVLLFYSRRGTARSWLCKDCGHLERCPNCDIALAYHTDPKKVLLCHQCNFSITAPLICPNCHGSHFIQVGVGIQKIQTDLIKILGDEYTVTRIDSDTYEKFPILRERITQSDVIVATSIAHFISLEHIGAIVFACFEINLSLPEYNLEEQIFSEIAYFKKQGLPIFIQTYLQQHPLLDLVVNGNYQSFLNYTKSERLAFQYPPYVELAILRIHHEKKERVDSMVGMLIHKISYIKKGSTLVIFDQDIWERHSGEWVKKIILRDRDLRYLIDSLEVEIVRNRSVTLEWK